MARRSVLELAEQNAPTALIAHLQKTDLQEGSRQFHEWAESHDHTTSLAVEFMGLTVLPPIQDVKPRDIAAA